MRVSIPGGGRRASSTRCRRDKSPRSFLASDAFRSRQHERQVGAKRQRFPMMAWGVAQTVTVDQREEEKPRCMHTRVMMSPESQIFCDLGRLHTTFECKRKLHIFSAYLQGRAVEVGWRSLCYAAQTVSLEHKLHLSPG